MQRITLLSGQPTAIQAVIRLHVTDGGFHGLAALEPSPLGLGQGLVLAAMDDRDAGIVSIHAAITQIDHDLFGNYATVL